MNFLGFFSAGLIIFIAVGSLICVFFSAGYESSFTFEDWRIIAFTFKQATLSAFVSCMLAVPISRALVRRDFILKSLLVSFLGAPFILPVLVAVLGFTAIFGRSGLVNFLLSSFELTPISIYGTSGIVLVHVFFNLPIAIRFLIYGWGAIPAERFRLTAQLGMSRWHTFRIVEIPMLINTLPSILVLVFLLCISSFGVALTMGGGPAATTIEVAIYYAFRYDFDLTKASYFASAQMILGLSAILVSFKIKSPNIYQAGLDRHLERWDCNHNLVKVTDYVIIVCTAVFIFSPIVALTLKGGLNFINLPEQVLIAAFRSVLMSLASTILAMTVSFSIAHSSVTLSARFYRSLESVGYLPISVSPLVLGTGVFICLLPFTNPNDYALEVTIIVNALMSVPFIIGILINPIRQVYSDFGRLGSNIGLSQKGFITIVLLPRLSRNIGFAAGLACAISMGDFGVIALFSAPDAFTLPMAVYSLMGAYRLDSSSSAALLLLVLTFGLFYLFDMGGRLFARN